MPVSPAPEDFFSALPDDRRATAEAVHQVIVSAAPDLNQWVWQGRMWGGTDQTILAYGTYEQVNRSGKKVRWFVIGLANQKAYLSLYVSAVRDNKYLSQIYEPRLGKVKVGSSSIGFRKLEDLNLDAVAEMVAEAAELSRS